MPVSPITFFFDFSSPYAYLASTQIEAIAARHLRDIEWVPVLLGPVFQTTGARPLIDQPLKGDYARIDIPRSARYLGVPFVLPSPFPIATHQAARVFIGLQREQSQQAVPWLHRCYSAYFTQNRNLAELPVLEALAAEQGLASDAVARFTADPAIKAQLKANVDRALEQGMCGAPFMVVDEQPFWGVDRLPQLEHWLSTGGF
ncbi:2-hydroxychromene-2-carboxylate isomerase [Thiomonas bhubaneswarensis]|uniref:2-hydroxychromene-2-carboxylate isomerase n=1 Tax=Thiomonas bhubaneswarensis TaxID=339866 RepID=A0A0K6HRM6_9BURK|nr:2-hydroxychromene-2-carboxylate isomerase [Thiomonas bhubaneswarensis]CUA93501.1 2-hydroxychromene-2-carboxylate isomerase [Thiomonas bhubaneswarensis]